jgi:hypothetical protein
MWHSSTMRPVIACIWLCVACAGRPPGIDGFEDGDAGFADAGVADAGFADAGFADAGFADAGVADAGFADAGIADAGDVDAGVTDAGVVDAVVVDAGVVDAGVVDAGVMDAGVMMDAGPPVPASVSDAELLRCARRNDGDVDVAIIISLDGTKSAALAIDPNVVPMLSALRRTGASTLDARTDPTVSVTLPNHTGMVTGRPVDGEDGHHVVGNSFSPRTVHDDRAAYTASIFDVAHDHGLFTMMVASKNKFLRLVNSWNPGAPDVTGDNNGTNKIDVVSVEEQADPITVGGAVEVLDALAALRIPSTRGALLFVHTRTADSAGHGNGFDATLGTRYMEAVIENDVLVSLIVEAVVRNVELCGHTSVFITTDHGGTGYGHNDAMNPENHTIPFIAYGPRAQAGGDLDDINADGHQPIRNIDVGQLALDHLGLPPVPGGVVNVDYDLRTR